MSSGDDSRNRNRSRNKGDSHSSRETSSSRCSYNLYSDDKQKILNQLSEGVRIELEDRHWQITTYSPLQFVIANKDLKRIVHAYMNKVSTEMTEPSGEVITKEYETLILHKATPMQPMQIGQFLGIDPWDWWICEHYLLVCVVIPFMLSDFLK